MCRNGHAHPNGMEGTQEALDGEQEEGRERVREEEREAVKQRNQTKRGYQRVNPICV